MNILITSVGRRSYMIDYFKESLQNIGKVYVANSEMTYAMALADGHVITPNIHDNLYIDFLLEYAKSNNITAIMSLFDIDLPVLAKNNDLFKKEGIKLIVSDSQVIEMCNDKWLTYRFLIDNEVGTPISFIDIESCLLALKENVVTFPLIIKPRWGMGSIGIFEAENEEELVVLYKKTKRIIERTYLKYESQLDFNNCVIIQEKILGKEYGLDIFNNLDGEYICAVPKQKVAMRAGETDIAKIISNPELEKLARELSTKVKHIGNLDVDCFLTNDKIFVLEMNARFGGQYPFSHLAGVNFPKIIIDLLLDKEVDPLDYKFESNIKGFKDISIKKLV